ncbi:peptidase inhibitor family I36 protein [Saccharothrix sp. ST-888]|uniref:peptidase inhibitor family I36 protein n=1 Tax=Saccharothrix sp. ST-888 TaxID=1427391 RepID=UPI000695DB2B|nr:peptidase inhibitor family I36 protein [Saccharothrix sp. ST-888]
MTTHRGRIAVAAVAVALAILCAYLGVRYSADDAATACPDGSFCLYGGQDAHGPVLSGGPLATHEDRAGSGDGAVHSVLNRSTYWACLYEKAAFGGAVKTFAPGAKESWDGFGRAPGGGFGSVKPAKSQAGCLNGYERCPERSLCLFQEPSGRGPMKSWADDASRYGDDWPGHAASVWNRSVSTACLYRSAGYTGQWTVGGKRYAAFVVPPGNSVTLTGPYAQAVGSHKLVTDPDAC